MRSFTISALLFGLPIICTAFFAEYLIREIPNDYRFKKQYLDKNAQNIKVLILGNSHAFYGLDPLYFHQNTFNAAYISQSLDFDHAILQKYSGRWKALKYIVIPIDYFTLYTDLEHGAEQWRVKNYEIYYHIHLYPGIVDNVELLSNNVNINSERLSNYYIKHISNITCSSRGWGLAYNSSHGQDLTVTGRSAAKRHRALNENDLGHNIQILTAIINFAASKNMKVIIYTSPAYRTYYKYLDQNKLASMIRTIKGMIASHPNTVYYNWLMDTSFLSGDFYDADHLNEIGARKLSLRMECVIDSLAKR